MALRPLSRSWPLLGALLLASPLQAQTAAAQTPAPQTQARDYAIEAGPLSTVLPRFAGEAGLLLSADGELTRGKQSPGLRGRYTVPAGLEQLLEGTGLRYRLTDDGGLTLEPVGEGHTLAPVAVTGTAQSRYESRYADSALRLPKDVADVPRSLDVIPEQLLLDQQSRELAEVFRLAPNVTVSDGYGGTRGSTPWCAVSRATTTSTATACRSSPTAASTRPPWRASRFSRARWRTSAAWRPAG
ncbi:STN domain-containing protein [Alloalcanivorax profundimaris]|uniref:STN domain-containing protein n=1 Tax=Alloalcanivorax profundimaris TaxID=2735259 RepID=UPI001E5A0DD1|nr:secretin and TonB N-terminal domain-containing protein [Alloalcanivorax profundimaris]